MSQISIEAIFAYHRDVVVPGWVAVQQKLGSYPVESANELRNSFTHLARYYNPYIIVPSKRDYELRRALSHLERIALDHAKMILSANAEEFERKIDDLKEAEIPIQTSYFERMEELRLTRIEIALKESNLGADPEYSDVCNQYIKLSDKFDKFVAEINYEYGINAAEIIKKRKERNALNEDRLNQQILETKALNDAAQKDRNDAKIETLEAKWRDYRLAAFGVIAGVALPYIFTWISTLFNK